MNRTSAPDGFVLEVTDQGPGILAADIDRGFERFWRGQGSRHIPSWGLGLWASRYAALSLGERIEYLVFELI